MKTKEMLRDESYAEREARLEKEAGSIKVEIEVSRRFLAYQCSSADIGYWADSVKRKKVYNDEYGGGHLITEVVENYASRKIRHRCNWAQAIRIVVEKYPWMLDEKNMDCASGDNWAQLAALGELRYG